MSRFVFVLAVLGLALPAAAQSPQAPPEAYRLDVLTPGSMYAFHPNRPPFLSGSRTWSATLDGRPISEQAFYRTVGRDDLARDTGWRTLKVGVLSAAAAGIVGAVLIAQSAPSVRESCRNGKPGCSVSIDGTRMAAGTGLMVGGLVAVSVALPMTRRAVPARDAADAARRFNTEGR